ncbi:hypothetical protein LZ198_26415 [Myxococcus sp. K15C18031901]|uniref:hypothetical protein n=1 Tax=Myxococcus dinghuensis TaxID=2906761 RepID=UPI0020A6E750|nr:hypothetical protein [Myxococcus dinghuensis]MCP3102411.1 hypothetical protein [Myxococcus dinghuensis]
MRNVIQGLLAAVMLVGCGGAELDSGVTPPETDAPQGEVREMKDCEPCSTRLDNCMNAATTQAEEDACIQKWLACTKAYCAGPTLR